MAKLTINIGSSDEVHVFGSVQQIIDHSTDQQIIDSSNYLPV